MALMHGRPQLHIVRHIAVLKVVVALQRHCERIPGLKKCCEVGRYLARRFPGTAGRDAVLAADVTDGVPESDGEGI
jgi:hypothetical protein